MPKIDENFDRQQIPSLLVDVVKSTFKTISKTPIEGSPEIHKEDIIEYDSRMRIFGMAKFNAPCYVSYVNFYLDEEAKSKNDPWGAMILYVDESLSMKLLQNLGYHGFTMDDHEAVGENCASLCRTLSDGFLSKVTSLGYPSLAISQMNKTRNNIPEGVGFYYEEQSKYSIDFTLFGKKVFVIDVSLAPPLLSK